MRTFKKQLALAAIVLCAHQSFAQWQNTTGNNIGISDYLGSNGGSTNPLTFKTGNPSSARMTILGTGTFVGIGTTTPKTTLHVAGQSLWLTGGDGGGISGGGLGLRLYMDNGSGLGYIWAYDYGTATYKNITIQPSGGQLGVGTTSPLMKLHVQGVTTANDGIRISQTGTFSSSLELYNSSSGARNWSILSTGSSNGQGAGNFVIRDVTSSSDRLFFSGTNGNIGVGSGFTNSVLPISKLHVDGDLFVTGAGGAAGLLLGDNNTTKEWGIEYDGGGMNFWTPFGSTAGFANYRMYIKNNGNVGINTIGSNAKLTVNGTVLIGNPATSMPGTYGLYVENGILSNKVRVAVPGSTYWADYVFADDYKLKSISELETFVKDNKHLPNIPSAEDVVKNGIDLGNMDAKLLEKIEELTLYIIQQNKRIEKLEQQIQQPK
jgi:hypothetical protein